MVPEKAEHLVHEDMVALSLLVRGFKMLSDMCINLYTHMLLNIHSSLMAYPPNIDHLQCNTQGLCHNHIS